MINDQGPVDLPPSVRPLTGQQVALLGRLRSSPSATCAPSSSGSAARSRPDLTPRTTVVVAGAEAGELPAFVTRVLSEGELCRAAGLPDVETLREHYYSAKDLRGMYVGLTDEHLRYLEKWGLVRPVVGRFSFSDLHVVRRAVAELEQGVALPGLLRALSSEAQGQLAFEFQARAERPPARVVSLPAKTPPDTGPFAGDRAQAHRRGQSGAGHEVFSRRRRTRRRRRARSGGRGGGVPARRAVRPATGARRRQSGEHVLRARPTRGSRGALRKSHSARRGMFRSALQSGEHPPRPRTISRSRRQLRRGARDQSRLSGGALLPGGDAREARSLGRGASALARVPAPLRQKASSPN